MVFRASHIAALATLAGFAVVTNAQHLGDVWVGHSTGNQIDISPSGFVPGLNYHTLSPVSGLLHGWTDASPGFDHITADDPNHDLYSLQAGAAIWLQIVAIDSAVRLIDSAFNILDAAGQRTYLGGYNLHVHDTWHINSDDLAYDPNQCVWHVTVFLSDAGSTGYAATTPFTFYFTNVSVRPPSQPATGDFDESGAVGLVDWLAFEECYSGPELRPSPGNAAITTCEVSCLNAFDFDNDLDLDLIDLASVQTLYAGG